jgi:hypothetical protein
VSECKRLFEESCDVKNSASDIFKPVSGCWNTEPTANTPLMKNRMILLHENQFSLRVEKISGQEQSLYSHWTPNVIQSAHLKRLWKVISHWTLDHTYTQTNLNAS